MSGKAKTWAGVLRGLPDADWMDVIPNRELTRLAGNWASCAVGEVTGARRMLPPNLVDFGGGILSCSVEYDLRDRVNNVVQPTWYSKVLYRLGVDFLFAVKEGRHTEARRLLKAIKSRWASLAPSTKKRVRAAIRARVYA